MKAEIRVMLLQTKNYQRLPAYYQKLGATHGTEFLSQESEDTHPADTLILHF